MKTRAFFGWGSMLGVAGVLASACGSSSKAGFGTDDAGTNAGNAGDNGGFNGLADSGFAGCATASYVGHQAPAAMLVALDRSGTMSSGNKYAYAQQAIISSIDADSFDSVSLGLLGYPSGEVPAPPCIAFVASTVTCQAPGLPQVPIAIAGQEKSSDTGGHRREMRDWLSANAPTPSSGNGNPTYDALNNGIAALKAYANATKRVLLYITDGGASCTSVSSRQGYTDANQCADWEHPDSIVSMLGAAHDDKTAPVSTFVVGVPGADTTGADPTTEPPYHVRLALSAYAYAGSPETADPACDGRTYSQAGGDPAKPCHFDMTTSFSAQSLTDAINQIRGTFLGCVFDLPAAPEGGTLDPSEVNVVTSDDPSLARRSDSNDPCTSDGCWDYTPDGKVELFGKACTDVKGVDGASVNIVVGCATRLK